MHTCKNYRPNENSIQMPGACIPHQGQIIADLYDEDGKFVRSAVVADVGAMGLGYARQYCERANKAEQKEVAPASGLGTVDE